MDTEADFFTLGPACNYVVQLPATSEEEVNNGMYVKWSIAGMQRPYAH